MASNADLHAAAERFVQARDLMMKARSHMLPQVNVGLDASDNKESQTALFRGPFNPIYDTSVSDRAGASWEPDFWYAIRNETNAKTYLAQQKAAEYTLARLSLQAEIASDYFTLRGYDAQTNIYNQSIVYYKQSLDVVNDRYVGKIASALDVARAKSLLFSTEAKALEVRVNGRWLNTPSRSSSILRQRVSRLRLLRI